MKALAGGALAVCVALGTARARADEASAEPSDYQEDARGRRVRTRFDPASRLLVGAGASGTALPEPRLGAYLETAVLHRHRVESDPGVSWKLSHEVLSARIPLTEGDSELELALYRGRYLRWSEDARLVLPTSPPRSLPFPLDVGLTASLGELRYAERPGGFAAELGVADLGLALDPWRSSGLRSWTQIAVGPRYELRLDRPSGGAVAVEHVVAPFTAGSFTFHHESDDGHHAVEAKAGGGASLRVGEGFAPRAEVALRYEAIVLALNDLPLSAYAEAGYRYDRDPAPVRAEHELTGALGMRFSVPIH